MKTTAQIITELGKNRLIEEVPESGGVLGGIIVADQMAVSIAISLKRIADAIDGTTLGVDMSESLCGITLQFIRKS